MSPTPRPCENFCVAGISLPAALGPLMGCISHGCVGSLPGVSHIICPWLSFPLGCTPQMRTFLPLPCRSAYCGVSLQQLVQIRCAFHGPASPLGFSYQYIA